MTMTPRQAVAAFSLSDKVKSGLIWATGCIQQAAGLEGPARQGARLVAETLLGMVLAEALCAHRLTGDPTWDDAVRAMDKAQVMIRSGVPQEAPYHLTNALSQVTRIGQRAAETLNRQGLL